MWIVAVEDRFIELLMFGGSPPWLSSIRHFPSVLGTVFYSWDGDHQTRVRIGNGYVLISVREVLCDTRGECEEWFTKKNLVGCV